MRRLAIILCGAAVVLLGAALLAGGPQALVLMSSGMAFGFMATMLHYRSVVEALRGTTEGLTTARAAAEAEAGDALAQARAEAQAARDEMEGLRQAAERLRVLEATTSRLRHDLRGILSPAMLTAERLTGNADPAVKRAGDMVMLMVERVTARLDETKA